MIVDIVVGSAFGDEGKGKVTSALAATGKYTMVARWAGGNNAGHTVYVDGEKYKTHLVPSGVFRGIKSVVGPNCVLHPKSFMEELNNIDKCGFDTSLVKVAPNVHIVTDKHIAYDKDNLAEKLGTTAKGIAPCYADKAARVGILAKDVLPKEIIWDTKIKQDERILCEGAQGFWLDTNHGLYPYVTSSETLPYGACSIGVPSQSIQKIYGVAKIYDTRSGEDPRFPDSLLDDKVLSVLGELGKEYGVTTGRRRKVNWLNLDMLINATNIMGTTDLIINKCDIIIEFGKFKVFQNGALVSFLSFDEMSKYITKVLYKECSYLADITFSYDPEKI